MGMACIGLTGIVAVWAYVCTDTLLLLLFSFVGVAVMVVDDPGMVDRRVLFEVA